jgi:hypothetical protein
MLGDAPSEETGYPAEAGAFAKIILAMCSGVDAFC